MKRSLGTLHLIPFLPINPAHWTFKGGSSSKDDAQHVSVAEDLCMNYLFGCEVGSMNWNSTTHVLSLSCRC